MAKIRTFKTLDDAVYQVRIVVEDVSEGDNELIEKYGEPDVDLGGSFTGPPAFTLTSRLVTIVSESPHIQRFDSRDDVNAEDKANVWADEVELRIQNAFTTLRGNVDGFSGEEVITV